MGGRESRDARSCTAVTARRVTTVSRSPTIGVLALQGDVREHLRAAARRWAPTPVAVRRPAELDARRRPGHPRRRVDHDGQAGARPSSCSSRCATRIARRAAGLRLLRRDDPARRPDRRTAPPDQETLGGLDIDGAPQRLRPPGRLLRGRPRLRRARRRPVHAVFIRAPWVEEVGAGRRGARPRSTADRPPVGSSRSGRAPAGHLVPPRADRRPPGAPAVRRPGARRP